MHRKANIRIPQAVFKRAFGPWAEFWQAKESSAWSHSMCYELHLILWLSRKLSKKKVGRLFFWVFLPLFFFFVQGVSTILECVFPHPADLGQGGICQEGQQLPKAVTRVQSSLVQFGVVGLAYLCLLGSLFVLLFLKFAYWFISLLPQQLNLLCVIVQRQMYHGNVKYLFLRWHLSDDT